MFWPLDWHGYQLMNERKAVFKALKISVMSFLLNSSAAGSSKSRALSNQK